MINIKKADLIERVGALKPGAPLDKFICDATFYNFKGLASGTRITFDFPLTAIVGANGSGKSSILHALWGMPLRQSTSRFWFSTDLDPIEGTGLRNSPRYFFSHYVKALKRYVQTRKMRISRRQGYWEPARLSVQEGMQVLPQITVAEAPYRSRDRWTPPSRQVLYMNFKCEFSSFDRFFYFPPRGESLEQRQTAFLNGASKLRRVIDRELQTYSPGGKEAIFANRELTADELKWVGFILGRDYDSARFVQHRLYGNVESPTVLFKRMGKSYSEAFAGSGELAIVLAVIRLLGTNNETLVLLDEPETSLHPGAQDRLLIFLLEMIRTKQLQIVISTHSPAMVDGLPTKAIAVLEELPDGKSIVIAPSHPQVAFNRLGARGVEKFVVAVEDALLLAVVEIAAKTFDPGEREAFDFYVPPGGASSILEYEIPIWLNANRRVFAILDGDQAPKVPIKKSAEMTEEEQNSIGKLIKDAYGIKPLHVSDGNKEPAVSYVNWIENRLRLLDAVCPEYVMLEGLIGKEDAARIATSNQLAKRHLIAEMEKRNHRTDAASLAAAASFVLHPGSPAYYHVEYLSKVLREFLAQDLSAASYRLHTRPPYHPSP